MRAQQREERNRAAFELASAYASPPSATVPKRGGASSWRPLSARSSSFRRCTGGRSAMASSARSGRGWAEGVEEPLSLDIDFRRRREGTARRRRMVLDDNNPVNDIEALEEENHKLKVALSSATEENKRYRVNKTRLEGELLRADDKIEILLFELEQTPGKRDQRLLHAARSEMEKCAVVRTLAKQRGHLQQLLARQERELDTIKRTKEWSAVMEMTAVTEEYFLEIQRLQRLIIQQQSQQQQQQQQQQQTTSASNCFHDEERNASREEYTPNRRDQARRRSSGVDSVLWRARPEAFDGMTPVENPVRFEQDAQDVEIIVRSPGDKLRNNHQRTWGAAAADEYSATVPHRENHGMVLHDPRASPTGRDRYQRPLSPKRRVSPPRRAQMVSRAGGENSNISAHARPQDQHFSHRTKQRSSGRWLGGGPTVVNKAGGSRSQGLMRAASATTRRCGSDARTAAAGLRGRRPLSAPRRSGEFRTKLVDEERRVGSASSSSSRAAGGSSSGVGVDGAGQPRTARIPSSSSSSLRPSNPKHDNHAASTVPVVSAESPRQEHGERGSRRPSLRSHSASPRSGSFSSREKKDGDVGFVTMSDVKVGGHGSASRHDDGSGEENRDGRDGVGGRYSCLPANLTAARPPQGDGSGPLGAPEIHDRGDESDDVYDSKRDSSSWSRGSLTEAAATAETAAARHTVAPPAPVANECEDDTSLTPKRHHQQAEEKIENSCNGEDDPRDSYSSEQAGAQQGGDESGHQLAGSASSWGGSDEEIIGGNSSKNTEVVAATTKAEKEGVVRMETSSNSYDAGRWSNAVETTAGENGAATKASITVGHNSSSSGISVGEEEELEQEQEEQVIARKADVELSPAASNSGRSSDPRSGGAEPGAEVPRSSIDGGAKAPPPHVGGGVTTSNNTSDDYSSSSQAIMEAGLDQGETAVGEADTDRLLFDGDGGEEDEQLGGENDAAPSEYGDDFDDDFDDEEG
ncbi:unnamed protein product [Ectocarpus fasciculatus]